MVGDPHDDVVITGSVRVPRRELDVSFSPTGGPGGQHANRSHTRVVIVFDVEASSAFSPTQRERLVGRLGPRLRIVADSERSQARNRAAAERRLAETIRDGLHVEPPRRATKPSRGATRRRLDAKSRRSQVKRQRRRPPVDD